MGDKVSTVSRSTDDRSMNAKAMFGITWKRSLDKDVCVVVGTLGKQFGKWSPWFVQLCLVDESSNGCRRAIGDGDAPEDEVFGGDILERRSLISIDDEILQGGHCLCRGYLNFERIRHGFTLNETK